MEHLQPVNTNNISRNDHYSPFVYSVLLKQIHPPTGCRGGAKPETRANNLAVQGDGEVGNAVLWHQDFAEYGNFNVLSQGALTELLSEFIDEPVHF